MHRSTSRLLKSSCGVRGQLRGTQTSAAPNCGRWVFSKRKESWIETWEGSRLISWDFQGIFFFCRISLGLPGAAVEVTLKSGRTSTAMEEFHYTGLYLIFTLDLLYVKSCKTSPGWLYNQQKRRCDQLVAMDGNWIRYDGSWPQFQCFVIRCVFQNMF